MAELTYGSATDVGRIRQKNQDSLAVLSAEALDGRADGLFIVADGMGGHAGGEIASRVTVETVPAVVMDQLAAANGHLAVDTMVEALRGGIEAANEAVWKQGRANPELRGMGTTCVALMVRDGQAAVGNVGDSRAYLLRSGKLVQITSDHSLVQEHVAAGSLTVEEARGSRFRNVITRGIGIASQVEPDVDAVELEEGDVVLLCSDGLTNMVREPEIMRILRSSENAQEACGRLIEAANRGGGVDNITALVVHHGEFTPDLQAELLESEPSVPQAASTVLKPRRRPITTAAIILAVVCALVAAALVYVSSETYTVTGAFPFVRHKPPPKAIVPPTAPIPNLAAITYGPSAVVTKMHLRPAPLASDAKGFVYAVDAATGRTVRIGSGGESAREIASLNSPVSEPAPVYFASDSQGNLYVSIRSQHEIQKFTPQGLRIGEIGKRELTAPSAIAVDSAGSIYVVDAGILRVFRPQTLTQPSPLNPRIPRHSVQDHETAGEAENGHRPLAAEIRNGAR